MILFFIRNLSFVIKAVYKLSNHYGRANSANVIIVEVERSPIRQFRDTSVWGVDVAEDFRRTYAYQIDAFNRLNLPLDARITSVPGSAPRNDGQDLLVAQETKAKRPASLLIYSGP